MKRSIPQLTVHLTKEDLDLLQYKGLVPLGAEDTEGKRYYVDITYGPQGDY